jgi:hypothetical protein
MKQKLGNSTRTRAMTSRRYNAHLSAFCFFQIIRAKKRGMLSTDYAEALLSFYVDLLTKDINKTYDKLLSIATGKTNQHYSNQIATGNQSPSPLVTMKPPRYAPLSLICYE